jgi:hypothetical protein
MTKKKPDNGHWSYRHQMNPEKYFGFVYLITCTTNGMSYIGKKQFYHYKKRKRVKETDWKIYTSSSKDLNADIKKLGKGAFTFKVVKQYRSRGHLVYGEANLQHKKDVLTQRLKDKTRAWYNKQIGAIRYVPTEIDK